MSVRGRRSPKLPAPGVASNPGEFVMPACFGRSAGDHRLAQIGPRESRAFVNHQRGQVWLLGSLAVSGDAVQYWPHRASDSAVRRRHLAVRRQVSIVPVRTGNEEAPCDVHVLWSAAETGHGSIDTRSCAGSPTRGPPLLVHARYGQTERPERPGRFGWRDVLAPTGWTGDRRLQSRSPRHPGAPSMADLKTFRFNPRLGRWTTCRYRAGHR